MATDYGTDFSWKNGDLDPNLSVIEGPLLVAVDVMQRLQEPRGGLFYDSDYGTDLRQYINDNATALEIGRAATIEAGKDDRVESASAKAETSDNDRTVTVHLTLFLAEGPFELVISVTELTVELISFEPAS